MYDDIRLLAFRVRVYDKVARPVVGCHPRNRRDKHHRYKDRQNRYQPINGPQFEDYGLRRHHSSHWDPERSDMWLGFMPLSYFTFTLVGNLLYFFVVFDLRKPDTPQTILKLDADSVQFDHKKLVLGHLSQVHLCSREPDGSFSTLRYSASVGEKQVSRYSPPEIVGVQFNNEILMCAMFGDARGVRVLRPTGRPAPAPSASASDENK